MHQAGIRVVLDGVFNHVGRGFWAFQDVKEKREASPYKDWFHINFGGNSGYNDGFWYEGWEGHYELVKLNLQNPAVVDYLLDCVGGWMEGVLHRRPAAGRGLPAGRELYAPPAQLRAAAGRGLLPAGGDDPRGLQAHRHEEMLDSATNYECYKGLYSALTR